MRRVPLAARASRLDRTPLRLNLCLGWIKVTSADVACTDSEVPDSTSSCHRFTPRGDWFRIATVKVKSDSQPEGLASKASGVQ